MEAIKFIKKYKKPYIGKIDNLYYDNKNHNYEYYYNKNYFTIKYFYYELDNLLSNEITYFNDNKMKNIINEYKLNNNNLINNNDLYFKGTNNNIYYITSNNNYIILDKNLLNYLKVKLFKLNQSTNYYQFNIFCQTIILDLNQNDYYSIYNIDNINNIDYNITFHIKANNVIIKNNYNCSIKCNNIILQNNIKHLCIKKDILIHFNEYKINKLNIEYSKDILKFNKYSIEYLNSLMINKFNITFIQTYHGDTNTITNYYDNFKKIIKLLLKFKSIKKLYINSYDNLKKDYDFKNLKLNYLFLSGNIHKINKIINIKNIQYIELYFNIENSYNKILIDNINNNYKKQYDKKYNIEQISDNAYEIIIQNKNNKFNSLNIINNNLYLK